MIAKNMKNRFISLNAINNFSCHYSEIEFSGCVLFSNRHKEM